MSKPPHTHGELSACASEEVDVLLAVYGEEASYSRTSGALTVLLPAFGVTLRFCFPPDYPALAPPVAAVSFARGAHADTAGLLERGLADVWRSAPGCVALFNYVEWLRAQLQDAVDAPVGDSGDDPQARAQQTHLLLRVAARIMHGEPLMDRKSTFQAHLCACESTQEVEAFLICLLDNKRVAAATHNIMAFRVHRPDGVMASDFDDDGETAAGSRLLHLLTLANCSNVCVVVSRCFGGIQLGPDRFKHISNVARDLLDQHGFIQPH